MRARLTLIATALVTAALLIAGAVMVLVLHNVLLNTADGANTARAHELAEVLADHDVRDVDDALLATDQNVDIVQIVDASGRVLVSSRAHADGALGAPVGPGQQVVVDGAVARPSDAEYRATRIGVRTADGTQLTVEVGTAEAGLNRLVLLVAALCAAVFPVIVLVVAILTHVFVGRALAPVELIRGRVAAISDADLGERVPVPATGDELETLARTMNDMLARLDSARTTQRRFVGDASHELNSPLTSIYGLLDLAEQTRTPVDLDTVRTLLLPEAARMRALVADLALLARADEGVVPARRAPVDLSALVRAEAQQRQAAGERGVTVDAPTVPVVVTGDPGQLARVLRNLTANAARYRTDVLALAVTVDGTTATVAVSDDGPGVPEVDRQRVFDRFTRLDAARDRAHGGSGLGLAIVADIVVAHGGIVGVDAAAEGGARLFFSLPLAAPGTPRP